MENIVNNPSVKNLIKLNSLVLSAVNPAISPCYKGKLNRASNMLKKKEDNKYIELKAYFERLNSRGYKIPVEFEFNIEGTTFIYDLVIFPLKVAIEFDGPHHQTRQQRIYDAVKDAAAEAVGWRVVRIPTKVGEVIAYDLVHTILREFGLIHININTNTEEISENLN